MIASIRKHLPGLAAILLVSGCAGTMATPAMNDTLDAAAVTDAHVAELAAVWAQALQARDGQPRYEMMSRRAKAKFEQEQIDRSGEEWNFNIGDSSPWVIDYDMKADGMSAAIHYMKKTSEPAYYRTSEYLVFTWEDGKLVVDDYNETGTSELQQQ